MDSGRDFSPDFFLEMRGSEVAPSPGASERANGPVPAHGPSRAESADSPRSSGNHPAGPVPRDRPPRLSENSEKQSSGRAVTKTQAARTGRPGRKWGSVRRYSTNAPFRQGSISSIGILRKVRSLFSDTVPVLDLWNVGRLPTLGRTPFVPSRRSPISGTEKVSALWPCEIGASAR
jgi:hypothetical protein